jgi:hypothetical protein
MHLKIRELKVELYHLDDNALDDDHPSTAIRVEHRHSGSVVENNDTNSPRENLRRALASLVKQTNPKPSVVTSPNFFPFDLVIVRMPESTQQGFVRGIDFDYKIRRWKYDVACNQSHADGVYDAADLDLKTVLL